MSICETVWNSNRQKCLICVCIELKSAEFMAPKNGMQMTRQKSLSIGEQKCRLLISLIAAVRSKENPKCVNRFGATVLCVLFKVRTKNTTDFAQCDKWTVALWRSNCAECTQFSAIKGARTIQSSSFVLKFLKWNCCPSRHKFDTII